MNEYLELTDGSRVYFSSDCQAFVIEADDYDKIPQVKRHEVPLLISFLSKECEIKP